MADKLLGDRKPTKKKADLYAQLGRYAGKRISRERSEAKFNRQISLYGRAWGFLLKYHHYDYRQKAKDGYDWIDLVYVETTRGAYL